MHSYCENKNTDRNNHSYNFETKLRFFFVDYLHSDKSVDLRFYHELNDSFVSTAQSVETKDLSVAQ